MYQKILVPLDGSKLAEVALPHAESLATRYDAALIFLSVLNPPIVTDRDANTAELYQQQLNTLRKDTGLYLPITSSRRGSLHERAENQGNR